MLRILLGFGVRPHETVGFVEGEPRQIVIAGRHIVVALLAGIERW
jgi:hypothetical protein